MEPKTCSDCRPLIADVESTIILCPKHGAAKELAEVLEAMFALIDDKVLVRDISHDSDYAAYTVQGLRLAKELAAARTALNHYEGRD